MTENTKLPFLIKDQSITVVFPSGPKIIRKDALNFIKVVEAIKAGEFTILEDLMSPAKAIVDFTEGSAAISNGEIVYNGVALNNYLTRKIVQFKNEGLPWDHLMKFLDKLMLNPSFRAREELYKFLETEDLPITEDGFFLAYKAVRKDMFDWHSGKFDNNVGKIVSMPRPQVDDNQTVGCSQGLHAGSLKYVNNFHPGESVKIIVKIDPADVVCIPNEDCNKLRCCKYEVTGMFESKFDHTLYNANGSSPLTRDSFEDDDIDVEDFEQDNLYYKVMIESKGSVADGEETLNFIIDEIGVEGQVRKTVGSKVVQLTPTTVLFSLEIDEEVYSEVVASIEDEVPEVIRVYEGG